MGLTLTEVVSAVDSLSAGDLVVGIQSEPETFRFTNYRLRTHLYTKELKNIDHVYLTGTYNSLSQVLIDYRY